MEMKRLLKLMEDLNTEPDTVDSIDTVTVDIPLMIRMLEYAREDAQTDMDLHDVAEKMIELAKEGTLTMDDYDSIVRNGETSSNDAEGRLGNNENELDEVQLGHTAGCAYNYGHDCDCGKTEKYHDDDCAYNYGHDCDCGLTEAPVAFEKPAGLHVEHRDPEGRFVVVYNQAEGMYYAIGKGLYKGEINKSAFQDLESAIEHAEMEIAGAEEPYEDVNESMVAYGATDGNTGSNENIHYSHTKEVGNGTLTISASATNMNELHDMLKLAGISVDSVPAEPTSEPEVAVEPEQPASCGCGSNDTDPNYSTDKTVIADKLRQALKARLS